MKIRYEVVAALDQIEVDDEKGHYIIDSVKTLAYTPISKRFENSKDAHAFKEKLTLAINAHDKLLAAVKMVFAAADDGGDMNDIDWDMLRDAYNLGLKGEA